MAESTTVTDGRRYWAATHRGLIRQTNEDRFLVLHDCDPDQDSVSGDLPENGWAAVADGMGGHEAGELASQLAIDAIRGLIAALNSEPGAIEMLHEANRQIFAAMRAGIGKPAMGTTLVGIKIRDEQAIIFNIGDSRAYLLHAQELRQLSTDDVPQNKVGHQRSHALTQALGGLRTEGVIKPHVRSIRLAPQDSLVLCSDGLSDMISDDEICAVLMSSAVDPAKELVAAALAAGGHDNVTVIVIEPSHIHRPLVAGVERLGL